MDGIEPQLGPTGQLSRYRRFVTFVHHMRCDDPWNSPEAVRALSSCPGSAGTWDTPPRAVDDVLRVGLVHVRLPQRLPYSPLRGHAVGVVEPQFRVPVLGNHEPVVREGAVCLVEPLLSPHAGADGVVRVTDGALEAGVAQEDMPGVVRGLQHAGDDRLFPGVDHRGPADFDVPAVLKGPVAAGELAAE